MTYISWSSDFALYLEDCLMYEHHTSELWVRIMSQYDLTFDFKINVGHFDLYFMVQWFCLISWSLIDIWTPYFGIMSQYDPMFALKIIVGHCDLYFMVRWFCHILKTFWCMNTILWYYESVWPDVLCKNKCRSLWPIFHGPVILSNILKTAWCMNNILQDYESGLWVSMTWYLTSK